MNNGEKMNNQSCTFLCPLRALYGEEEGIRLYNWLLERIKSFKAEYKREITDSLDEKDVIVITYPDQFIRQGQKPLQTLNHFSNEYLNNFITGIHILPFFPWSSDDGFSVKDYCMVEKDYGSWQDICELGDNFSLMFDAVINHISSESEWFLGFVNGDPEYADFFITCDPDKDLSMVVRPRTSPLLTKFSTETGDKWVWTTFSADQIDINYKNPQVFKNIVDILLFYVKMKASFIRLDAIAYLWKEARTKCIHLPQTHAIIHLFNQILDSIDPNIKLITETNVPHEENVSYFGDGDNEAHLVYNFSLPPLVLNTFYQENSRALTEWTSKLSLPSNKVTFFNFLASHDGIGITPVHGILSEGEIENIKNEISNRNGFISYKKNQDQTETAYELNISYFDALSILDEQYGSQNHINRFICAHAIMFSLVGLPGIYIHSLLGSPGWLDGVELTGKNRTINRKKFQYEEIIKDISTDVSIPGMVYKRMKQLISHRAQSSAFHPHGAQLVLDLGENIFALLRISPDGEEYVLCVHNITANSVELIIEPEKLGIWGKVWRDIISDIKIDLENDTKLKLEPFQVAWFKNEE